MADSNTAFSSEELERLRALRRAAAEINQSTVIRDGTDVGVSMSARLGEGVSVSRRGHDPERFRSFMIALRRTYAQNDGANFLAALNAVSKNRPSLRADLKRLRDSYLQVLRSSDVMINGLGHEEIFKAWLYGSVFHDDDPDLRQQWKDVSGDPLLGAMATMIVEAMGLQLAEHVLALDLIVADILGEPQLQRPTPSETLPPERSGGFVRVTARRRPQKATVWIDFTNDGPGDARDVTLERFSPLTSGEEGVLMEGEVERKFPVPRLRRGERVSLMAALTMGSPCEYEVVVAWEDPDGSRREEDFRLDLLSV